MELNHHDIEIMLLTFWITSIPNVTNKETRDNKSVGEVNLSVISLHLFFCHFTIIQFPFVVS